MVIRTNCPACGDVSVRPKDIRLEVVGGGEETGARYAFACPVCGRTALGNAESAAVRTLKAAGASATTGPDLDKLPLDAQKAGKPLADFIHESIVDPNAYIAPGFPKNVMPATFGQALSKQQLDALVQYLISSSKKG